MNIHSDTYFFSKMFKIFRVAYVPLNSGFSIRIKNFNNNFTHLLEKFILVFLIHIRACVSSCLGGLVGGRRYPLGSALGRWGQVQGDIWVGAQGRVVDIFPCQLPEVGLSFSLFGSPSFFPSNFFNFSSFFPSLFFFFFPFLK